MSLTFTTKYYGFLYFLVEKIASLLNIGMVFWQVFVDDMIRTENNKPSQLDKKNLKKEPGQTSIRKKKKKCAKLIF